MLESNNTLYLQGDIHQDMEQLKEALFTLFESGEEASPLVINFDRVREENQWSLIDWILRIHHVIAWWNPTIILVGIDLRHQETMDELGVSQVLTCYNPPGSSSVDTIRCFSTFSLPSLLSHGESRPALLSIERQHQAIGRKYSEFRARILKNMHHPPTVWLRESELYLVELLAESKRHFITEEHLMNKFHYPRYTAHQTEHETLIHELLLFENRVLTHEIESVPDTLTFLERWLMNHIQQWDQKLFDFLRTVI
ncbi:MAG: hemerythrin family protein [Desulfamplus sp.]|nr:hemerythrin family protein [Desulfamplus sp.]